MNKVMPGSFLKNIKAAAFSLMISTLNIIIIDVNIALRGVSDMLKTELCFDFSGIRKQRAWGYKALRLSVIFEISSQPVMTQDTI